MKLFLLSTTFLAMVLVAVGGYYLGSTAHAPEIISGAVEEPAGDTSSIRDVVEAVSGLGATVPIYDGINVAASAKTVDVSGRGLTGSLKAEIRMVSGLEVLNLSGNNFTGLPAEVGQLRELRTLNLANNNFTGLPHELGNLEKLELLDLRGNNIATFDLEVISKALPSTTRVLHD
jgi:Leucine-rich repeat (LRR) protein